MDHCSCSGAWAATVDVKEIEKKLQVLQSAAQFHDMALLAKVVGDVLAHM